MKMRRCEDVKMRRCFTDPHYWKNPALRRSREKDVLHREPFTNAFAKFTQRAFPRRGFYTEKHSHRELYTHRRSIVTEKPLHTETFTHRGIAHRNLYTDKIVSHRNILLRSSEGHSPLGWGWGKLSWHHKGRISHINILLRGMTL